MSPLVFWATPPLVGAIIGYVTNAIAIKMLFRPLTEKRVFGIRLPFTPGILPRQRHQLADNIGRMVSRELLTEDILRERIRRDDFLLAIEGTVSEYSDKLLSTPIGKLALEIPALEKKGTDSLDVSDLARLFGGLAERFIASPVFADLVRGAVSSAIAKIGEKSVADLAGGDRDALVRSISAGLSGLLSSALSGPAAIESLAQSASKAAESLAEEGRSIGSALPSNSADSIALIAEAAYPVLVDAALRYVSRRDVRAELETHGRVFLRDAILRLNVFQRLFLSAAQYDRTLHEQMPEIVDDLLRHVGAAARQEKSRSRFGAAVRESVERFLSLPVGEAAASVGAEPAALARRIVLGIAKAVSSDGAKGVLSAMFAKMVGELVDEPLRRIAEGRLGLDLSSLSVTVSTTILNLASSNPGPAVAGAVDRFLAERGETSIADLFGISRSGKKKLDSFLADRVVALIDDRISSALATLDIRKLVSDRIDSLDMESVESIVLDILANQLRWINVFGAILGALIGLAQATLSIYLR